MEKGKYPQFPGKCPRWNPRTLRKGETTLSASVSLFDTKVLSFRTITKQTLGRKRLLSESLPSALWLVTLM